MYILKLSSLDGASTIFVSDKAQINIELLYHYIMHRAYNYQFKFKALVDEKERVFIPAGFDSLTLIKYSIGFLLCRERAKNVGETLFEDIFKEPAKHKENIKEELKCEDFSLILAQWKASSTRKTPHTITAPTTGVTKPTGFVPAPAKEPIIGKPSIVSGTQTTPEVPATIPAPQSGTTTSEQPPEAKSTMASAFWTAMKSKTPASTALVKIT